MQENPVIELHLEGVDGRTFNRELLPTPPESV